MRRHFSPAILSILTSAALAAGGAHAQTTKPDDATLNPSYTQIVKEKSEKLLKDLTKKMDGWDNRLTVGTSFALSNSTSVVGRPDGTSASLGGTVDGLFTYKRGLNRVVNTVNFQVQQTHTPLLAGWVKSLDALKIESTYLRDFETRKWLSFYAGTSVETALFGGEDQRIVDTIYRVKELNGSTNTEVRRNVLLTKEFSPAQLQQGFGANFIFVDEKPFKLTSKVGFGFQEVFARNGVTITNVDLATNTVDLLRLQDYAQAGGQIRINANGEYGKAVTYNFFADFFFPVYNSIDTQLRGLGSYEKTISYDVQLKVGLKLAKWASLDYVLGIRRIPLIADVTQIWNGVFISFAFNVIEERKLPKIAEKTDAQKKKDEEEEEEEE